MKSQPIVDFWYEFSSPYSFLAAERIDALASSRGVGLNWRPFLLGAVFKAGGLSGSPNLAVPAKTRHMWRDVERSCDRLGIPWQIPEAFPRNGILASRVALALPDDARPAFTKAVFRYEFCEGRDIADPEVVADAVRQTGFELEPAVTAAQTDLVKHALRRQTDQAMTLGIFGAPTLITPDGELFWGNDRLEGALDWAVGRR
jgi:2-hydroxychromene-2-carboxylate isomerase